MGTSRVAIAGGAFRVRTGNLCTMFGSLESAAEQIAMLHDEIERLRDQHDTYVKMLEQLTRRLDGGETMEWLDEMIDRVNAGGISGEWATQSQVAATSAVDKLELPAIPDDAVVDLVGCLIDEVVRLRDWMQRVTDAVVDWRTKVTGNAGSGCPIDAVVVLSARLRKSEALIEQLRALLDGYEAMEKSMKQEASG